MNVAAVISDACSAQADAGTLLDIESLKFGLTENLDSMWIIFSRSEKGGNRDMIATWLDYGYSALNTQPPPQHLDTYVVKKKESKGVNARQRPWAG